ncbi:hypothetical protein MPSEU_000107400 [Mayamaea pseudoterrestris]|nr:hypothetical protein MPSEU_000107400 [Mayamaea pseudoterrestris]
MRCCYLLLCLLPLVTSSSAFAPASHTSVSATSLHKKPSTLLASVPNGGAAAAANEDASPGGGATIPNEVFNLVKSIVGAGVLSLPAGVAAFGNNPSALVPALLLIASMGALSAYTFQLIGRICQSTKTNSYSEAWDAVMSKGNNGKSASSSSSASAKLIAFSCFIDCFAGNLSYSMILADTVRALALSLGFVLTRTQSLVGVTGAVLVPLCLLKNLSSLAPFSLVGIVGMLYTTLVMGLRYFGKSYALGGAYHASQLATPVFGSIGASGALTPQSLILMCMLSNAYIAHFNAPKFLAELRNPTMPRFNQVIGWSFGTSVLIYGLITAFGFLTFGAASNGLILNNYSTADGLASLSRIAVAISITCSYPLIFVGARDGLLDLFKIKERNDATLNKVTFGIMALVTLLAAKLTDLGLVASVGGATFGTALVFVYPVIMFLKSQTKRTRETIPAALIGVLGVCMGAVGTVLSLKGADL